MGEEEKIKIDIVKSNGTHVNTCSLGDLIFTGDNYDLKLIGWKEADGDHYQLMVITDANLPFRIRLIKNSPIQNALRDTAIRKLSERNGGDV